MLRMGKKTSKTVKEVLAAATDYFGPGGVGLDIIPAGPQTVQFRGGGGYVQVKAETVEEDGETKTDIDIQSKEWDYDVKRFLGQL